MRHPDPMLYTEKFHDKARTWFEANSKESGVRVYDNSKATKGASGDTTHGYKGPVIFSRSSKGNIGIYDHEKV
jgi:hypothetical protein